jgi:hypothetical protein
MSRLPDRWERWENALNRRGAALVLLGLLGLLYTWAYWQHPLNPGGAPVSERRGWWSWADQYKYWQATDALAHGKITREVYHYPLGYSALGAPFVRLWPAHPYFVPDLLLVLGTAALGWRLARRWLPATVTLGVALVFLAAHGELLRLTMVVPWNTLPTQLTLLAGLWLMLETRGPRTVGWLAGLAALTWLVRPIDAVSFAPLLLWSVLRLSTWRERIAVGLGGLAILAAAMAGVGALNLAVWGAWRTPYELGSQAVGFFSYPTSLKLYWTFVDARLFFGEADTALLWRYPWLPLAVPGMIFWVKREGAAGMAALASVLLSWLVYLGYNDFFPSSFYRFSLIHYVSWSFLPLFAAAAGACWAGWKMKSVWLGWLAALALVLLAGGLQLEERSLPGERGPGEVRGLPAGRPLWVRFPGEPLEKVPALRLDGRALVEAVDYQIPYVASDLKLLLGDRARGKRLSATPEAALMAEPQVGDFRWGWRWDWSRRVRGN